MSTIFASYTPLIPPTPSVFIYDCFIMTVTHQGVPSLRRLTLLFSATIDFLKLLIQWRTSKIFISMLACWLLLSLLRSCLSKNLLKFHGTVSQSCLEDYISIFLSHLALAIFLLHFPQWSLFVVALFVVGTVYFIPTHSLYFDQSCIYLQ